MNPLKRSQPLELIKCLKWPGPSIEMEAILRSKALKSRLCARRMPMMEKFHHIVYDNRACKSLS